MNAYDPVQDIANFMAVRNYVGDAVRIGGKKSASKALRQAEEDLRKSVAASGFTRNNGVLKSGLFDAINDYITSLNATADASIQSQQDFETIAVGNIVGRMQNGISIFARAQTSLTQENGRVATEQLSVNAGYKKAAINLSLDAQSKAVEEQHAIDLFNIKEQSDVSIKVLQHNGDATLRMAEVGWDISAQEALLAQQNITKSDVLGLQLARIVPREQLKITAEISNSTNENIAKNSAAINEANARLVTETNKGAANIAAVNAKSAAELAGLDMTSAAKINALNIVSTAEQQNVTSRANAQLSNAALLNNSQVNNAQNEINAEIAANLIELNGKVAANFIEENGRLVTSNMQIKANINQQQMTVASKISNAKLISTAQISDSKAKGDADVINIQSKSSASIYNQAAIINGKLSDLSQSIANKLLLQAAENSDELNNIQLLSDNDTLMLKLKNIDATGNLASELSSELAAEIALQNVKLSNQQAILNAELARNANEVGARTYANTKDIQTRSTVSAIDQASTSQQSLIKAAADANISMSVALNNYWDATLKQLAQQNIALGNITQETWYIKD